MSFLSFIGGVAEGYNEDEKAKAAAASKMKEIEMQALLSALAELLRIDLELGSHCCASSGCKPTE